MDEDLYDMPIAQLMDEAGQYMPTLWMRPCMTCPPYGWGLVWHAHLMDEALYGMRPGSTCQPYRWGRAGHAHLMDEAGQDMPIFNVEVIIGTEYIGGNNWCVLESILRIVALVHDVQHPLGVAVALVRRMWRPIVYLKKK